MTQTVRKIQMMIRPKIKIVKRGYNEKAKNIYDC